MSHDLAGIGQLRSFSLSFELPFKRRQQSKSGQMTGSRSIAWVREKESRARDTSIKQI